ncbi:MAG: cation diffusion facilitator family transporter [Alphaproteobacteria bacterium]|nr:cation diffusion facilitator family transporter [Alphaproteobacteria bacterium]
MPHDPVAAGIEMARLTRRAAVASSSVAIALIVLKTGGWWITGSVALLSSLVDSLLDAVLSLVTLAAVQKAAKPADREHRWGHGKVESVAALAQGAFIGGSAALVLVECGRRLLDPVPVRQEVYGIAVSLIAIIAGLALVAYQTRVVRATRSEAIAADRAHYGSDFVINGGVIVSLVIAGYGGVWWVDPLIGAAIAAWMGWTAYGIGRRAINTLMDHELPDDERVRIRDLALADPEVRGIRDLRTRRSGADTFIQMILLVDGAMTVSEAHRVVDRVERRVCEAYPSVEVLIHEEPETLAEERSTARRPGSRHGR